MLKQFLIMKREGGDELMPSTDDDRMTTQTVDPGVFSHASQMNNESLYDLTSFKFPATTYDLYNDSYIEISNESQYDHQRKDEPAKELQQSFEELVPKGQTLVIHDKGMGHTTDEALVSDRGSFENRNSLYYETEKKKEPAIKLEEPEEIGGVSEVIALKVTRAKASKKRKHIALTTKFEQVSKKRAKPAPRRVLKKKASSTRLAKPTEHENPTRFRSKMGCWICRLKHKKCDETTPQCTNCTKQHIQCDYSKTKPSYIYNPQEKCQKLKDVKQIWLNRYKVERFLAGNEVSVKHLANNKTYDKQTQQAIKGGS